MEFISSLLPSGVEEKQCPREAHAAHLCTSHPRRLPAPLPVHFNISQLFNIHHLCRFVLLISYSWPEEMCRRVVKRVRTLLFKGAASTTAGLQPRTHVHARPGAWEGWLRGNQTKPITPLKQLGGFSKAAEMWSGIKRGDFREVQEPLTRRICAEPCRNAPFPFGTLRKLAGASFPAPPAVMLGVSSHPWDKPRASQQLACLQH